jgi:hypothetical protein
MEHSMPKRRVTRRTISKLDQDISRKRSGFGIDLPDEEAALEMGKQLAEQTGKSVTIRDSKGTVLVTFARPMKQ